jgi:hypothetical protein
MKALFLILCLPSVLWAQHADSTDEYVIKKEYQRERVEDFYKRFNDIERADNERRQGEDEMRAARKRQLTEYERDRAEFVKQRKLKPQEDNLAWENETKQRAAEYERDRREFVVKQRELRNTLRREGQIPEEDEYDLYFEEGEGD